MLRTEAQPRPYKAKVASLRTISKVANAETAPAEPP